MTMLVEWVAAAMFAATGGDSCGYGLLGGTEFEFRTDSNAKSTGRFAGWYSEKPHLYADELPYERFAGTKGKLIDDRADPSIDNSPYRKAMSENCEPLYLQWSRHSELSETFLSLSGITILQPLPTSWAISEITDKMTDEYTCAVSVNGRSPPYPWFGFAKKATQLEVSGSDYPGTDVSYRVDENTAVTEKQILTGERAQRVLKQIRAGGKKLLVRAHAWPENSPSTAEYDLGGLVEKLDECRRRVAEKKK